MENYAEQETVEVSPQKEPVTNLAEIEIEMDDEFNKNDDTDNDDDDMDNDDMDNDDMDNDDMDNDDTDDDEDIVADMNTDTKADVTTDTKTDVTTDTKTDDDAVIVEKSVNEILNISNDDLDDDLDDDSEDEDYLKKLNDGVRNNLIEKHHPEALAHNYEEISALTNIIRDKNNNINDPLHTTMSYLTKYERTRVLGQRAKQINSGARPFVGNIKNIIDGYIIAEMELNAKLIPFIIRRPLPNGGSEYWKLSDLQIF